MLVLCLNIVIPQSTPIAPPINARPIKVDSLILQSPFFALYLSAAINTNETKLIIAKILKTVKLVIIITSYHYIFHGAILNLQCLNIICSVFRFVRRSTLRTYCFINFTYSKAILLNKMGSLTFFYKTHTENTAYIKKSLFSFMPSQTFRKRLP